MSEGDANDGNANKRQRVIHADAVVVDVDGNGQEATNSASNPGQTNEKKWPMEQEHNEEEDQQCTTSQ